MFRRLLDIIRKLLNIGRKGDDVSENETMGETIRPDRPERPGTTEISRQTISDLGAKLDKFAAQLSEDEQMTLATAFALATRGFLTFPTGVACQRDLRFGIGRSSILVERITGAASRPRLSDALADAFCSGNPSRYSIEGLEVERSVLGSKSVAAGATPSATGAKSVAAWANPALAGSKSVAACANPGYWGARVSPAGWRVPGMVGSKSVAAACANPALMGSKSVAAACRNPGLVGGKSVAAACRMPGFGYYY